MSKFKETMTEMGYSFVSQEEHRLSFKKKTFTSCIFIVFNLQQKYIDAYIEPHNFIRVERDLDNLYKDYKQMRVDAISLANLSNYVLLD